MNAFNDFATKLTGQLGNVTTGQAALGGIGAGIIIGGVCCMMMMLYAIIAVLQVVSIWFMYEKAGDRGWKAIIPFYGDYTMYKLTWNKSVFWIVLVIAVISGVFSAIGQSWAIWIAFVAAIAYMVIYIISKYKIAKAFGHGIGYTLGLIFLGEIFYPIIGFGSSEYVGPDKD